MKRIISLILVCVLLMSLCACQVNIGNGKETVSDPKDFAYEEVDGGLRLTQYTGKSEIVVIPSVIDSKKVIDLDKAAFSGNVTLKEITLPETITAISFAVFNNCESLEKIVYLGKISQIDDVGSYAMNNYLSSMPAFKTLEVNVIAETELGRNISQVIGKSESLENIVIHEIADFNGHDIGVGEGSCFNIDRNVNITMPEYAVIAYLEKTAYATYVSNDGSLSHFGYRLCSNNPTNTTYQLKSIDDASKMCIVFGVDKVTVNGVIYQIKGVAN